MITIAQQIAATRPDVRRRRRDVRPSRRHLAARTLGIDHHTGGADREEHDMTATTVRIARPSTIATSDIRARESVQQAGHLLRRSRVPVCIVPDMGARLVDETVGAGHNRAGGSGDADARRAFSRCARMDSIRPFCSS